MPEEETNTSMLISAIAEKTEKFGRRDRYSNLPSLYCGISSRYLFGTKTGNYRWDSGEASGILVAIR